MGMLVMAGELHELSTEIGKLQKGMEALERTVRDNQETATEEHRKVHDIVVATSEAVRNLAAKVSTMEPLTDDYRERRAEARGAAHLAKFLLVTVGSICGAVSVKLLDYFAMKPHP